MGLPGCKIHIACRHAWLGSPHSCGYHAAHSATHTRRSFLVAHWISCSAGRCAVPAMDCQQWVHGQGTSRQPQQPPPPSGPQLTDYGHGFSHQSFAPERQLCQAAWGSALGLQSAACERLVRVGPSGSSAKECQASTWTAEGTEPGGVSLHLGLRQPEGSITGLRDWSWVPPVPGPCLRPPHWWVPRGRRGVGWLDVSCCLGCGVEDI